MISREKVRPMKDWYETRNYIRKAKDLEPLLEKFINHLEVLNRSPSTIRNYVMQNRLFFNTVKIDDINIITRDIIETYITGLFEYKDSSGKPYMVNTICIKVRSIKCFFKFLEKHDFIFINPAEYISVPKSDNNKIRDILTYKEFKALLAQADKKTAFGFRDRAILEVFYSTGIRIKEICTLKVNDVDFKNKVIRIKGKGQKDRVIPVGKHAIQCLKGYITEVRPGFVKRNNKGSKLLFTSRMGAPLNKDLIRFMINKYTKASGITKKVTPHTFRRSFATALVKNNADIVSVQRMLAVSTKRDGRDRTRQYYSFCRNT